MLEGEPKQVIATIYGAGVEAKLILNIPNNKNIEDITSLSFYKEFETYQGVKINEELIIRLKTLKKQIKEYCKWEPFVSYESTPGLVLEIWDSRDRVKRC